MSLLSVRDLSISVAAAHGTMKIVSGVSLEVDEGEAIALVGESGCGKTLTAYAIMQLLPKGARIDGGAVTFRGADLVQLPDRELCRIRGASLSMVFQEPSTALNPVYTVGSQITEVLRIHRTISRREARALAEACLGRVGMPAPRRAFDSYPHELSGGMKQRALLAIALVSGPALLIADEPTTSLDRTLEAQVFELIRKERDERKMAVLLVSHDLATVRESTSAIFVMYAGEIVERGPTAATIQSPLHPYTQALVGSVPNPAAYRSRTIGAPGPRLPVLRGMPPSFEELPTGCRFAPRCEKAFDRCLSEHPPFFEVEGRSVRCFLHAPDLHAPDRASPDSAAGDATSEEEEAS